MNTSIKDRPRATAAQNSVKNLPVNLFGSVMGLAGLSLAWRLASMVYGASTLIAEVVGIVAILVFIALGSAYIVKWARHSSAVKAEFTHPIAGNFFGTISIGVLLLSTVVASYSKSLQGLAWTIGAISTIVFSTLMIARLLKGNVDGGHLALKISGRRRRSAREDGQSAFPWRLSRMQP
jgi:tellurite resistance protein